MIFSSVILARREGMTWRNFLGVILGVVLLVATLVPDILNNLLRESGSVDIYNSRGILTYVVDFVQVAVFMSLAYVEIILISTVIMTIYTARLVVPLDRDYVIILGCMVLPDGTLGGQLKRRADAALEFARRQEAETGKFPTLVGSGGKGADEPTSEGAAIREYLMQRGVDAKRILVEDRSTTTEENLKYSSAIIAKATSVAHPKVAFVTNGYHVFRAGYLANWLGYTEYRGVGAKTRLYFWINAFIREFVAEMVLEQKKHLLFVLLLWGSALGAFVMLYISGLH